MVSSRPVITRNVVTLTSRLRKIAYGKTAYTGSIRRLALGREFSLYVVSLRLPSVGKFRLVSRLRDRVPRYNVLVCAVRRRP